MANVMDTVAVQNHQRHSVVFLIKTLYGTFSCVGVLASSSKFQSYLIKKLKPDSNILVSPETLDNQNNRLMVQRFRGFLTSQKDKGGKNKKKKNYKSQLLMHEIIFLNSC